jgi:hypothetical protein
MNDAPAARASYYRKTAKEIRQIARQCPHRAGSLRTPRSCPSLRSNGRRRRETPVERLVYPPCCFRPARGESNQIRFNYARLEELSVLPEE